MSLDEAKNSTCTLAFTYNFLISLQQHKDVIPLCTFQFIIQLNLLENAKSP